MQQIKVGDLVKSMCQVRVFGYEVPADTLMLVVGEVTFRDHLDSSRVTMIYTCSPPGKVASDPELPGYFSWQLEKVGQ